MVSKIAPVLAKFAIVEGVIRKYCNDFALPNVEDADSVFLTVSIQAPPSMKHYGEFDWVSIQYDGEHIKLNVFYHGITWSQDEYIQIDELEWRIKTYLTAPGIKISSVIHAHGNKLYHSAESDGWKPCGVGGTQISLPVYEGCIVDFIHLSGTKPIIIPKSVIDRFMANETATHNVWLGYGVAVPGKGTTVGIVKSFEIDDTGRLIGMQVKMTNRDMENECLCRKDDWKSINAFRLCGRGHLSGGNIEVTQINGVILEAVNIQNQQFLYEKSDEIEIYSLQALEEKPQSKTSFIRKLARKLGLLLIEPPLR
jgi:hypothetical protein